MKKLEFFDCIDYYPRELFYKNDFSVVCADPGCLYVSKEDDPENGGWFYMYSTGYSAAEGKEYAFSAYPCYRSRDLSSWERIGAVDGSALRVMPGDWAEKWFWAPEVIRDGKSGKYYMYFSAGAKKGDEKTEYTSETEDKWACLYLGIAVSDTPFGPFVMADSFDCSGGVNLNGDVISGANPPFNFERKLGLEHYWSAIDVSPFFAPDGSLYVYFAKHVDNYHKGICVYGMRMKDMISPDYSTLTKLTHPSVLTGVGRAGDAYYFRAGEESIDEGGVNEGPFMTYRKGKYYLTYSPFGYGSRRYSIMQAVSDSPLGPFVKIRYGEGNPVIGINATNDYMAGTGHHNFAYAGDETWAIYHAHRDPVHPYGDDGNFKGRVLAADRIGYVFSPGLGFDIMRGNGPTASIQPAAEVGAPYRNVAGLARVESNASGDTVKYLTDGFFTVQDFSAGEEAVFDGRAEIVFAFDKPMEICAVGVYNSMNYSFAFSKIDNIIISGPDGESETGEVRVNPADVNADEGFMRQGGAAWAAFDPIEADKIKITASCGFCGGNIKISEVKILGR